jgi:hypothetical protein
MYFLNTFWAPNVECQLLKPQTAALHNTEADFQLKLMDVMKNILYRCRHESVVGFLYELWIKYMCSVK